MSGIRHSLGSVFNRHPDLIAELSRKKPDEDIILRGIHNGSDLAVFDDYGNDAVTLSVQKGLTRAVDLLLDKSALYDAESVFQAAAKSHNPDILTRVLQQADIRAHVNGFDRQGAPAVVCALGRYDDFALCARILIDAGAAVDALTTHGMSALMYAAENGQVKMLQALIDLGADLDIQGGQGKTALMLGVEDTSVSHILLAAGANPYIKDNGGATAYDYACGRERYIREESFYEVDVDLTSVFTPYIQFEKLSPAPKIQKFII